MKVTTARAARADCMAGKCTKAVDTPEPRLAV
jgi:hypothetical protein